VSAGESVASAALPESYRQPLPLGLHHLIKVMNALGTLWILGLVVLLNADVIGRNLLGRPILGVPEMLAMSIVGIVFLQLADCVHSGKLTRSELLLGRMEGWTPGGASFAQAVFHLAGLALMLAILAPSYGNFSQALEQGEYFGAIGAFRAPMWPIKLAVFVGLAMTAVSLLGLAWHDLRSGLARRAAARAQTR
jgi:TRAP-type C4-dicarboxylate transport system permease small subunit